MYISRKTDYSLILMQALKNTFTSGQFLTLDDIARQYHLPYAYLEKLAGALKRSGIVEARTGKNGGYRMARDPKKVTVQEIADIFQQKPLMRCLSAENAQKTCVLFPMCPSRSGWRKIDTEIRKALSSLTIAKI